VLIVVERVDENPNAEVEAVKRTRADASFGIIVFE